MSLLIGITFVVYLMPKQWSSLFWTNFSTSGIVSSFSLLLGLTDSWIVSFLVIKVFVVFFLLLLQVIRCWSGVTVDKFYPCPDKTEIPKSSLLISISEGFSVLVLFSDKLGIEIDSHLFTLLTVFSASVIWVDLDLSNYVSLSYFLMMGVSTFLLDACNFSVLLTVSIFLFAMAGVIASFATLGSFSHVSIPLFDNRAGSSNQCLFGFIQIPTCFYRRYNWIITFLLQRVTYIWRHDFIAWYSLPC